MLCYVYLNSSAGVSVMFLYVLFDCKCKILTSLGENTTHKHKETDNKQKQLEYKQNKQHTYRISSPRPDREQISLRFRLGDFCLFSVVFVCLFFCCFLELFCFYVYVCICVCFDCKCKSLNRLGEHIHKTETHTNKQDNQHNNITTKLTDIQDIQPSTRPRIIYSRRFVGWISCISDVLFNVVLRVCFDVFVLCFFLLLYVFAQLF